MTRTKGHRVFENGIPETYQALCMMYLPRPIHDEVAHANAVEIIDALSGLDLNEEQNEYLEILGDLVNKYEETHLELLPDAKPIEVLRFLIEDRRISTREIGRILGIDQSMGSKILSGDRAITVDHAVKLAKYFGIKPEVFLDLR